MSHRVEFDFYGSTIRLLSNGRGCLETLEAEFQHFRATVEKPRFEIELVPNRAPSGLLPDRPASRISPNAITYDDGPRRWNDHHGRALSLYDHGTGRAVVWSADPDVLHEVAYLTLLSLTGKDLDRRGFHKVHACGFRLRGRDVLVMLPSHGGKTTLFLEIARWPGVELLSDDTPLVDRAGKVWPFPLRLGVKEAPSWLPARELAVFKRQHHGDKLLIPLDRLGAPVARGPGGGALLLHGKRTGQGPARLVRMTPMESLRGLFEHMVVGIGLPMVVELFVRHTFRDWITLLGIARSRALAALRLWRDGESWLFLMGPDPRANAETLRAFLEPK